MPELTISQDHWKTALRAALVVGGVYTIFMVMRHYLTARFLSSDLIYVGGISFVMCTVPVFITVWILLALFGKRLLSTTTDQQS